MAHFKVPRTVVFGPLPKTSTGKIQKFVLRDQAKTLALTRAFEYWFRAVTAACRSTGGIFQPRPRTAAAQCGSFFCRIESHFRSRGMSARDRSDPAVARG